MAFDHGTEPGSAIGLHRLLDAVRQQQYEDRDGALGHAIRCHEAARVLHDASLSGRALVFQAAIALQRGDLRAAVALIADAERDVAGTGNDAARAELAAVKAQLSYFVGSYSESLAQAHEAIELADRDGDVALRVFVRRCACMVLGNVGVPDWGQWLDELLGLTVESANRWEEAVSRNDLAHHLMDQGRLACAEEEIERGLAVARGLAPHNQFVLGLLHATRADIQLRAGRAGDALATAEAAVELLAAAGDDPNPYVLAMTILVEVQALLALGRLDEAERRGERVVSRLGERVPQARSLILGTVATALREAGRLEEAYDALVRSAEAERRAFHDLSELQRALERASHETEAARRQAAALAAKNRELEEVVRELAEARQALARLEPDAPTSRE